MAIVERYGNFRLRSILLTVIFDHDLKSSVRNKWRGCLVSSFGFLFLPDSRVLDQGPIDSRARFSLEGPYCYKSINIKMLILHYARAALLGAVLLSVTTASAFAPRRPDVPSRSRMVRRCGPGEGGAITRDEG